MMGISPATVGPSLGVRAGVAAPGAVARGAGPRRRLDRELRARHGQRARVTLDAGSIWREVDEVFQAARDVTSVAERTAWLDARCAGRPRSARGSVVAAGGLRRVGCVPAAARPLDDAHRSDALPAAAHDGTATIVGAWRLIREIGEGGMGGVYLAERDDGTSPTASRSN